MLHPDSSHCRVLNDFVQGRISYLTPTCQPYSNQRNGSGIKATDHETYYTLLGGSGQGGAKELIEEEGGDAVIVEEIKGIQKKSAEDEATHLELFVEQIMMIQHKVSKQSRYVAWCVLTICATLWIDMSRPRLA